MAIPENYIDKITKDGDSRIISPSADNVRVDNENFEGADLDEVLDEVAQAIDEAGGGYEPPQGGIPKTDLASDVQASLGKADTALQSYTETDPTVPSWAKQPSKPGYNVAEITYSSGRMLSSKLDEMDAGIAAASDVDSAMSDTSENVVQNKIVKAYIDAVSARIDTLIGSGNVQGAIDTFNEVKAFLSGISSSDTLAAKLAQLATDISGKVDKVTGYGLSKNDYTDAEKSKLAGIAAGAEVNVNADWNASSGDAAILNKPTLSTVATSGSYNDLSNKPTNLVTSISVNGGTAQTPTNGNVNISVQGAAGQDGITPHIGSNGNWWLGPETNQANDTGIHAQGPAGTSYTSADLVISNALNGQGDVLGMGGAAIIKSNVDSLYASLNRLYSKLANMAFWDAEDQEDAEPTPLDWSVPSHTVTLNIDLVHSNVKHNGTPVSDGDTLTVDDGDALELTVEPDTDFVISSLDATVGGVSLSPTESGGVYTISIASVTNNITVVITGTEIQEWFTVPKDDVLDGNNVIMYGMQQGRSIAADKGFMTSGVTNGAPAVVACPAGVPTATKIATGGYVKPDGVNDTVNTDPGISEEYFIATNGKKYLHVRILYTGATAPSTFRLAIGCYKSSIIGREMPAYNAYVSNPAITGQAGRIAYGAANNGSDWKLNLHDFATSKGNTAGDITYIKLLVNGQTNSADVDTRTYYDGLTVKYKFTDD